MRPKIERQDYPILMISPNRKANDQESVVLNKILSIMKKEASIYINQ